MLRQFTLNLHEFPLSFTLRTTAPAEAEHVRLARLRAHDGEHVRRAAHGAGRERRRLEPPERGEPRRRPGASRHNKRRNLRESNLHGNAFIPLNELEPPEVAEPRRRPGASRQNIRRNLR